MTPREQEMSNIKMAQALDAQEWMDAIYAILKAASASCNDSVYLDRACKKLGSAISELSVVSRGASEH